MRLYFIRHAQSENNALWDRTGSDEDRKDDPFLTDLGFEQARKVARYIKEGREPQAGATQNPGLSITHLYCSPMYRAVATAFEIGKEVGIKPIVWIDWHEGGGMFLEDRITKEKYSRSGMNRAELEQNFPDIVVNSGIGPNGWWNKPWESHEDRPVRARRVLNELRARHHGKDDRIAVVSHGAFYNYFLAAVIGLEIIKPAWFLMNNTGISCFEFAEDDTTIVFHNHLSHLPPEIVS